jgi:hypothetical protein
VGVNLEEEVVTVIVAVPLTAVSARLVATTWKNPKAEGAV